MVFQPPDIVIAVCLVLSVYIVQLFGVRVVPSRSPNFRAVAVQTGIAQMSSNHGARQAREALFGPLFRGRAALLGL